MVELELLERGERLVALLDQEQDLLGPRVVDQLRLSAVAEEGQRHDRHRDDRDERAQD